MHQEHGGNVAGYKNITDFSANINPLGTPAEVLRAAERAVLQSSVYPDPFCTRLTRLIAEREGITGSRVVCGNGAADLIYRLVHAVRPKRAAVLAPTFSEYAGALNEVGCEVVRTALSPDNGFDVTDSIAERLTDGTDMVILCSPNNPTGRMIRAGQLEHIAKLCRKKEITLISDESFMGFVCEPVSIRPFMSERTVILSSFTKLYAIPGLRLGCALFGSDALAGAVRRSGQFWSVSTPAQAAGEAAVQLEGFEKKTAQYVAHEREFLAGTLTGAGFEVFPSDANFLLFRAFDGLAENLLRKGILIRECGSFAGLAPGYFRIAVRTHTENQLLAETLAAIG